MYCAAIVVSFGDRPIALSSAIGSVTPSVGRNAWYAESLGTTMFNASLPPASSRRISVRGGAAPPLVGGREPATDFASCPVHVVMP